MNLADTNDAELKLILAAAKKNKTVKKFLVSFSPSLNFFLNPTPSGSESRSLSVPAALSLASVVSEHPEIQEIEFSDISIIEFGPIALAIQQNRKLTRLLLRFCRVTPNLLECIRWLLTENALESMTLRNNTSNGEPSFDISGALLGNWSLKELVVCDERGVFGLETFQAIPHRIRTNQEFEILYLALMQTMTNRFELVRLIAQAAEGHASLNKLAITYVGNSSEEPSAEDLINRVGSTEAIGTMLHNAPALRELSLRDCYMESAEAHHLADGLSSTNSIVEKLDLSFNELGTEEFGIFVRLLLANQKLKSLVLMANNIGDAGALDLAGALRQNNMLELLDLGWNAIGSDGASALADALVMNDALKYLDLQYNYIGDDGATSIAEMLTRNESIEKVCFGGFGEKGLNAFVTCLSQMTGVKTIELMSTDFTPKIGYALVQALELNMTLETFDFDGVGPPFVVLPQVNRLLALNRGGRRLLSATGESVPPLNYWPRILARSSTDCIHNADVLFYFLREIPHVLVMKDGSRKRKRGDDDDETTSTVCHI